MEEVGIGSALKKYPVLAGAIFPEDSKRSIRAEEFKRKVAFQEREANAKTADYFLNYIQLMESLKEDGKLRSLLNIYITEITKIIMNDILLLTESEVTTANYQTETLIVAKYIYDRFRERDRRVKCNLV